MRISWSRMRRGALGVTFALTCASTVQFTGCLKSSTLGLSSDLSEQAGRTALEAEQKIAEQKVAERKKSTSEVEPASATTSPGEAGESEGRVELAGGPVPPDAGVALVQAEQKPRFENPLKKFLKKKSEKRVEEDPFLSAAKQESASEPAPADARQDEFEKFVHERQERAELKWPLADDSMPTPRLDDAAWEALLQQEFTNTKDRTGNHDAIGAAQAMSQDTEAAGAARVRSAPKSAMDRQTIADPFAAPSVGADPFASDPATEDSLSPISGLTRERRGVTPDSVEEESDGWFSADGPASDKKPGSEEFAWSSEPMPKNSTAGTPDSLELRRQLLRMKALISDSQTHLLRGELHAAYRSALLAERIADEFQILPEADEETPGELARRIAEQITRKSKGTSSPTVREVSDEEENSRPIAMTPSEHDRTFATITPFPRWEQAPPVQANGPLVLPSGSATMDSSAPVVGDLPMIRPTRSFPESLTPSAPGSSVPALLAESARTTSPRSFPQEVVAGIAGTEFSEVEARPAPLSAPHPSTRGVTFAIAESVEEPWEQAVASVSDHVPAPFPAASTVPAETRRTPAPLPPLEGPLLMSQNADSTKSLLTSSAVELESARATSDAVRASDSDSSSTVSASSGRSLQWGVLGFIAAILSTIIGLRLGRSLPQPPESAALPEESEEQEDAPQLRIRRAA